MIIGIASIIVLALAVNIFKDKICTTIDILFGTIDKPIIYIYPEEETPITVKLGYPEQLTVSYPEYSDGWRVMAYPSGQLKNLETNRNLYALYYEANMHIPVFDENEGFVVPSEDTAGFLEEKLAVLGLNEREGFTAVEWGGTEIK